MATKSRRSDSRRSSSVPPSREIALQVLGHCLDKGQPLQESLDAALRNRQPAPDPRDAGLATESVYGVCRFKGRLDFLLDHRLSRPGSIPPLVRRILLLAAYELLFLDRVPAYASVSWAVDAVKRVAPHLGKVANGVLRSLDRMRDEAFSLDFYLHTASDSSSGMAAWYGVPFWLYEHLASMNPDLAHAVLDERLSQPPLGIRFNPRVSGSEDLADAYRSVAGVVASTISGVAFASDQSPDPVELAAYMDDGRLSRQSLASQDALLRLDPASWVGPILDCCSGRGGKTQLYLERWDESIWASDIHSARLRGLAEECRRLHLKRPLMFRADARRLPLVAEGEGRRPRTILIDAPCSGLGVMSRRPDIAWRLRPDDLSKLRKIQAEILEATGASLGSGSRLLYMTCTVDAFENERAVSGLTASDGRFVLENEYQTENPDVLKERFYAASIRIR